jgi:hypothetical protein
MARAATPVRRLGALVVAQLAIASGAALADPGYYVVTVYDDPGLRTVDFRYWSVKPNGATAIYWPEVGLGWNVNGRWYTEVLASYVGGAHFATELENVLWQNDLLLTQGQYPVDVAIHTLWAIPQKAMARHSFEFGPVLQTDIDRTQVNFNLVFERGYAAESADPVELKYQWQLRHRWQRWLHVGAQGFGELGRWNHWSKSDAQSHRAGPALFGAIPAGPGTVAWQAAYLLGKTYGQRGSMLTMRIKYDF